MADRPSIDATQTWLKDRDYYQGQLLHEEVLDGREATASSLDICPAVRIALQRQGIEQLYKHQVRAIEATRAGQNTVVATPTASGKSMTYVVPALERAIQRNETTLYIAPMRALINDQAEMFTKFAEMLGLNGDVEVGIQTGETEQEARKRLKQSQPDVVLVTLDQIHLSVVPYGHSPQNWRWLFETLGTVVIDEVHMYRGHFGSHASLVFRRLNRLCEFYDTDADYICCSATIGNPVEHAAAVTGRDEESFTLINEDNSASGDQMWWLWNPPLKSNGDDEVETGASEPPESEDCGGADSTTTPGVVEQTPARAITQMDEVEGGERRSQHQESVQLFCDLVQRGYQTLVFTSARQATAQYIEQADRMLRSRNEEDLAGKVQAYHGKLEDDRRRELEEGLRSGELRGVWSTMALELGIDIGTLDAVILDGYPGTSMSTFQRAGRAGRGDSESLVILVASDNPLDQYVMRDPDQLFESGSERATINPHNDAIRPDHVVCAADDSWLSPDDEQHFGEGFPVVVGDLLEEGRLSRVAGDSRIRWESREDKPQLNTDIRSIGDRTIDLIDRLNSDRLGELGYREALRDAHPEALYSHEKRTYRVEDFRLEAGKAIMEPLETEAYTRALREKDVEILETLDHGTVNWNGFEVSKTLARLRVSDLVESYLYHENQRDDDPKEIPIEPLPPAEIETVGFFLEFPPAVAGSVHDRITNADAAGYGDALHAVEHAMISLFPREVLCDRADIGGLSTESHSQTTGGTIFIHDGFEGGAGYCRAGYDQLDSLVAETKQLVAQCDCPDGCPSCIHSPHCGNANRHLSKSLGATLLTAGTEASD